MEIKFTRLVDGTAEEYAYLKKLDAHRRDSVPSDLMGMLRATGRTENVPVADSWTWPCSRYGL